MNDSTIWESFTLPSKGMVYGRDINPNISLRSMTTLEEMKRLSPTDMPYKVMSDIIEDCMKEKPDIHVYDMCLGDYQFLLHKLRIVTYGPEYKMLIQCKKCNAINSSIGNLESLAINEWSPSLKLDTEITLPRSSRVINLKLQTPRDLDWIPNRTKDLKRKSKSNIDYSIMFTLMSVIDKVDGAKLSEIELENFIKKLQNKDANYIMNKAKELNQAIGLDNMISVKCSECGAEMIAPFRITSEFFGPTI